MMQSPYMVIIIITLLVVSGPAFGDANQDWVASLLFFWVVKMFVYPRALASLTPDMLHDQNWQF